MAKSVKETIKLFVPPILVMVASRIWLEFDSTQSPVR
jgi:hypothetical protein